MVYLIKDDFDYVDVIFNIVEDVVVELGGSFLVEYGIGKFKFLFMSCCKDFVVIVMMKVLKQIMDLNNILNLGKVYLV